MQPRRALLSSEAKKQPRFQRSLARVVYEVPRFNPRQSMEPTVQARQSGTFGRDHPNSHNKGSDSLTLSRDHGGYRPAFGTESGPSSDNLSHAQYGEPLNYQPQLAAIKQQFDFFTNPSMHPKQSARDPWVDFLDTELYHQLFAFFDFLSYVLFVRRFFSYFLDVLGDVLADLEAIPEDNGILVDEWEDNEHRMQHGHSSDKKPSQPRTRNEEIFPHPNVPKI
ncbi:hypothetical protein B0H14DRAFT_3704497 [Mycena olivaceomarginata]|nr:hypothetical protein B0H14DRAFT_3704497 [Mycena olivaceomarginata]